MAKDVAKVEYIPGWHLGWQWRMELMEAGQEYIVWPNDRAMKQERGRRCVFLGFEEGGPACRRGPPLQAGSVYYGKGVAARVHYLDDKQIDTVSLADLIPACYVGSRQKDDGSSDASRLA